MNCFKTSAPLVPEKSLQGVADYILSGNCKNIVTMAGAGISTSAGIPDFRSPRSGIYEQMSDCELPYPEAVFEIRYFKKNPKPFFTLCKAIYPKTQVLPTITHYFIKLIDDKGLLLRHYTQNVDALERKSGLREEKLIEAHGTIDVSHCINCHKSYNFDWVWDKIQTETVPKCTRCGGVVKPDVVLFGENLPSKFMVHYRSDFGKCDLLLILGTSLTVDPFASLVRAVSKKCPRVYINAQRTRRKGMNFSSQNSRDIAWIGQCDEGSAQLARLLGWADDLRALAAPPKPPPPSPPPQSEKPEKPRKSKTPRKSELPEQPEQPRKSKQTEQPEQPRKSKQPEQPKQPQQRE